MVVGYDHQFGHKRQGNFDELLKLSAEFGFDVEKYPSRISKMWWLAQLKYETLLA